MIYGCHNRQPYRAYYLPTGAPDTPAYRIPHVLTTTCQYTFTTLGQADPKCHHCKHRHETKPD